jgi:hypothetical protein
MKESQEPDKAPQSQNKVLETAMQSWVAGIIITIPTTPQKKE